MPAKHRYKCLNYDGCLSYKGARGPSNFFVAMNSPTPTCPHCRSMRLEDAGAALNLMPGISSDTQNTDANFRRVADRYGLTDMNNKDGRAVKRAAPPPVANGPTVNLGGIQIPVAQAAAGACVHMPNMAQKIPAGGTMPGKKESKMMRDMTRVVGEHKARA